MALTDPYTDVDTLKARLGISGTAQDAVLTATIEAASRAIDNWTGRSFGKSDSAEPQYFSAAYGDLLTLPDFVSIGEIAVDDGTRTYATVWEATDYDPAPFNAAVRGEPYTAIRTRPYGSRAFPPLDLGVRITAVWGWPAVPAVIAEATALQAARLYKRKDAPFGVTGSAELGQLQTITRVDPDVAQLIAPYKVLVF